MRTAAVSLVSVALVVGGAAAATAAPGRPAPKPVLTLSASDTHVKSGDKVLLSGRAVGLRDGSRVTLQEKRGGRWVTLPVATTVHHGTYRLTEKATHKGAQTLRTQDGRTVSKAVTISVR
ncbi:hypothetical protein BIV25_11350 [Streptomyces sp. MUSC 14]|uniref:hypothetical protein n=1 Tax=Streptomyces sp. MUSC 14 TaxID=1354889 RepID=UPI0008F5750F|nr:hypothetical protein [Streptomyces sp. MUSC 14]OIJ98830.1 hypothetical protein BIV25_11350 [Streptomyces sp. MUSC 14]